MRETLGTLVRSFVWLVLAACGSSGGGDGELVSIDVEPANATLAYTGSPVSLDYHAIGHFADGSTAELPDAVFSLDAEGARLGDIAAATFTASGQGAGKGGVIATRGDVTGATGVIVTVHRTDLGPGVPADGASHFPDDVAPVGAQSPKLVYPLQDAVMPSSVNTASLSSAVEPSAK
jgi:hypothetical protein